MVRPVRPLNLPAIGQAAANTRLTRQQTSAVAAQQQAAEAERQRQAAARNALARYLGGGGVGAAPGGAVPVAASSPEAVAAGGAAPAGPNPMAALAQADPTLALQVRQQEAAARQTARETANTRRQQALDFIGSRLPQVTQASYPGFRDFVGRTFGADVATMLPAEYDRAALQALGAPVAPVSVAPDAQLVNPQTGQVVAVGGSKRETFGQPVETMINGQPALVQVGNQGTVRQVQGVAPPSDDDQSKPFTKSGQITIRGLNDRIEPHIENASNMASRVAIVDTAVADALPSPQNPGGNPQSAYAALITYNKILDDGAVVREGDIELTRAATGLQGRIQAEMDRIASGQPVNADTLRQIRSATQRFAQAQIETSRQFVDEQLDLARQRGLDVNALVPAPTYARLFGGAGPAAAASRPPAGQPVAVQATETGQVAPGVVGQQTTTIANPAAVQAEQAGALDSPAVRRAREIVERTRAGATAPAPPGPMGP